jgi:putative PIN family toxin of toxin-antitoxin system
MATALLDTNILISYLLSPHPGTIPVVVVEAGVVRRYQLLWAQEIGTELRNRIVTKPYLAQRIALDQIDDLLALLARVATVLPPLAGDIIPISRDPKDDYLLAHAVAAQADFLVTGDRDLLTLSAHGGVQIVDPATFAQRLGLIPEPDR